MFYFGNLKMWVRILIVCVHRLCFGFVKNTVNLLLSNDIINNTSFYKAFKIIMWYLEPNKRKDPYVTVWMFFI